MTDDLTQAGAPVPQSSIDQLDEWIEEIRLVELGRLSSEMIHELRQPIFALRAVVQLHQAGISIPDLDPIETFSSQATSLEQLVDRYAATCNRPNFHRQPTAVRGAVESALIVLGARSRSLGRPLRLAPLGDDCVVFFDPIALRGAALHLLSACLERCVSEVMAAQRGPTFSVEADCPLFTEAEVAEAFGPTLPPTPVARSLFAARLLVERGEGRLGWETHPGGQRLVVVLPSVGASAHG